MADDGTWRRGTYVELGYWDEDWECWHMTDAQAGGVCQANPTHWFDIPSDDEGLA